jgi:hypothetical protein
MTIIFLHGLLLIPGGVKPTFWHNTAMRSSTRRFTEQRREVENSQGDFQ